MISLVAFDLDDTLALSKEKILEPMREALADLSQVAHVSVISGGDWLQFQEQIIKWLPARADLSKFWMMPTTGAKLYTYRDNEWKQVYAELLPEDQKQKAIAALIKGVADLKPEQLWGEQIEDRGSQVTFSALGQEAPGSAKEKWDPDMSKRLKIIAPLKKELPDLSIAAGGKTSIDVTAPGVDKGYGLKKLKQHSNIPLEEMVFIGDKIMPGGNDYPAYQLGLKTVSVKNPEGTLAAIAGIVACLSKTGLRS